MMTPLRSLAVVALSSVLWSAPSGATTVTALTLEDLTVRATDIVEGTVTELAPRWAAGFLVTDVTVEVTACHKGACLERDVIVQVFGGTLDGYVVEAAGSATYEPGEAVLLFLEPAAVGEGTGVGARLRTAGLALGKFRVELAGDLPVVGRVTEGLHLLGPESPVATGEDHLTLSDLRARIEGTLAP